MELIYFLLPWAFHSKSPLTRAKPFLDSERNWHRRSSVSVLETCLLFFPFYSSSIFLLFLMDAGCTCLIHVTVLCNSAPLSLTCSYSSVTSWIQDLQIPFCVLQHTMKACLSIRYWTKVAMFTSKGIIFPALEGVYHPKGQEKDQRSKAFILRASEHLLGVSISSGSAPLTWVSWLHSVWSPCKGREASLVQAVLQTITQERQGPILCQGFLHGRRAVA